ncbi:MAG: hypothetical protein ACLTDM_07175 [Clostridium butyricum]
MKLICDCGNEEEFNTIDEETGEEGLFFEDEGQYARIDNFRFWEQHDQVGIVCEKCGKSIWMFT